MTLLQRVFPKNDFGKPGAQGCCEESRNTTRLEASYLGHYISAVELVVRHIWSVSVSSMVLTAKLEKLAEYTESVPLLPFETTIWLLERQQEQPV